MALSATVVWEVRGATGSDNNGGGFNSAAAGTDYSTSSSSPHVVIDGATITLTVQAVTTSVKLVGYTVASTDVGNIVNINGGTMTAGRYQINSVTTGASNFWNLDRSAGTSTQTGTGNMGGSLATIATALSAASVAFQTIYVKADGTYAITAALSCTTNSANGRMCVIGYTSSRTDNGQVTVAVGSGAGINAVTQSGSGNGYQFWNFIFDGAVTSGTQGVIGVSDTSGSIYFGFFNCVIKNFSSCAIKSFNKAIFDRCEISGCAGGTTGIIEPNGEILMVDCYIHDNTKPALVLANGGSIIVRSIIANNSGASSDGVLMTGMSSILDCLIYGNGRDGVRFTSATELDRTAVIRNCLFAKNGGYGINATSATSSLSTLAFPFIDYNGYWSNSSGSTHNFTSGGHDVVISGTDPTNDPFVAKGSNNWALNNTAGAGTLLRGTGYPGAFPALTTPVGSLDIGPYQHQYPSSIVIINE